MSIESIMKEQRIFYPPKKISETAYVKSIEEYERLYKESVDEPEKFWGRMAEENISWFKKWEKKQGRDYLAGG